MTKKAFIRASLFSEASNIIITAGGMMANRCAREVAESYALSHSRGAETEAETERDVEPV